MSEAAEEKQILVGDIREGTGTHHVRVEVIDIDGPSALCRLVRSGSTKFIAIRTLQSAYALVRRAEKAKGTDA
jgi:hypothetical protein